MSWQLAVVMYFVFSVLKILFQKNFLNKSKLPTIVSAAVSSLIGILPASLLIGLLLPVEVHWSWQAVALIAAEGILIGLYSKMAYAALKELPIAQFQMITSSLPFFTVVLGWGLLGERLTWLQLGGGLLTMTSVLLVAGFQKRKRSVALHPAVIIALSATIVLSLGLIAEKAALDYMSLGAYFIFGIAAQTIVLQLFAANEYRRGILARMTPKETLSLFTLGIGSALAGISYITAIKQSDNISLIIILTAFVLPLSAAAGYWVLKERQGGKKLWFAIALGVLGIIITTL